MPSIHILKCYLLDKGSTMKHKREDIAELQVHNKYNATPQKIKHG
jgi:hypothetical protein